MIFFWSSQKICQWNACVCQCVLAPALVSDCLFKKIRQSCVCKTFAVWMGMFVCNLMNIFVWHNINVEISPLHITSWMWYFDVASKNIKRLENCCFMVYHVYWIKFWFCHETDLVPAVRCMLCESVLKLFAHSAIYPAAAWLAHSRSVCSSYMIYVTLKSLYKSFLKMLLWKSLSKQGVKLLSSQLASTKFLLYKERERALSSAFLEKPISGKVCWWCNGKTDTKS